MNIFKPIIIIGAGRSGTTLLTKIFDQHPDMDFRGETFFLIPRLWLEMWEDRFWFNWPIYTNSNPRSAREEFPEPPEDVLLKEQKRIGRIIANGISDLLKINRKSKKVWGYKEVWNGSSQFRYDWSLYDNVFPEAIWVHTIRNPFDFALSNAQWNKNDFDINFLYNRLLDWVAMIRYSRKRMDTGRYYEIRYEELIQNVRGAIEPILEAVDLSWRLECEEASKKIVLRSETVQSMSTEESLIQTKKEIAELILRVDGLHELLTEFEYTASDRVKSCISKGRLDNKQAQFVNLHDIHHQNVNLTHKPQYLLEQVYEQLFIKYQGTEQNNEQLIDQNRRIAEQNQTLTGQIQQINGEISKRDDKDRQLLEQYRNQVFQNEKKTESVAQLTEQYKNAIEHVVQLNEQAKFLITDKQNSIEILGGLNQQIRELTEQIKQLEFEHIKRDLQNQELSERIRQLETHKRNGDEENRKLLDETSKLSEQLQQIEEAQRKLSRENLALLEQNVELSALKEENRLKGDLNRSLNEEIGRLNRVYDDLVSCEIYALATEIGKRPRVLKALRLITNRNRNGFL